MAMTRLGRLSLLGMICMLTLGSGAGTSQSPKLVATSTLSPVQFTQPTKPAAIIEERIVKAPAGDPQTPQPSLSAGSGVGAVISGNNCVVCVRALTGRSQNGNAGTWKASHSTPRIGDIMIWRPGQQGASSAGHVGVVVGVHGNRVSIKHCNWQGQTEFASTGLFW